MGKMPIAATNSDGLTSKKQTYLKRETQGVNGKLVSIREKNDRNCRLFDPKK